MCPTRPPSHKIPEMFTKVDAKTRLCLWGVLLLCAALAPVWRVALIPDRSKIITPTFLVNIPHEHPPDPYLMDDLHTDSIREESNTRKTHQAGSILEKALNASAAIQHLQASVLARAAELATDLEAMPASAPTQEPDHQTESNEAPAPAPAPAQEPESNEAPAPAPAQEPAYQRESFGEDPDRFEEDPALIQGEKNAEEDSADSADHVLYSGYVGDY